MLPVALEKSRRSRTSLYGPSTGRGPSAGMDCLPRQSAGQQLEERRRKADRAGAGLGRPNDAAAADLLVLPRITAARMARGL